MGAAAPCRQKYPGLEATRLPLQGLGDVAVPQQMLHGVDPFGYLSAPVSAGPCLYYAKFTDGAQIETHQEFEAGAWIYQKDRRTPMTLRHFLAA